MVSCIALGCKNRSQGINGTVGFHTLPLKNPALLHKWLDALQLDCFAVKKHYRVCSDHFTPEDYKRDLRHELLGTRKKRQLRENAIPKLHNLPTVLRMAEPALAERLDERSSQDPLNDPLGEDSNVDIIPEFEVKEEPYDYYEDVTDTGSPCWISDGVTLIEDNDEDIELEDGTLVENHNDPLEYIDKQGDTILDDGLDVRSIPENMPHKVGHSKQKLHLQHHARKRLKNFIPYEVDVDDDDLDDGLEVTVENDSFRDDLDELGWKNKRLTDSEMVKRRRELENHLAQCKVNIKVMQARLDEERGKMMRIQSSLINLKRRQKRNELKRMQLGGNSNVASEDLVDKPKRIKMDDESKSLVQDDERQKYDTVMEMKVKMARLREIKARKALEQKNSGTVDYQKELENKLRMARLREIKAQKALERKLNEDKMTPEAKVKTKLKPIKMPKQDDMKNGEDYEKMLELKLKMARLREIKAMKALEKMNSEEGEKVVIDKKFPVKMKPSKKSSNVVTDDEKAMEMKVKMAKLREIKAQKALERKRLEELGIKVEKVGKKRGQKRKRKYEVDGSKEIHMENVNIGEIKEEDEKVVVKTEEKTTNPEIHIATSHMLWNVLSRIKMEPYQESLSKTDYSDSSSSFFSNQGKNKPAPSDIPKLVKDFMCREDISKVSTNSPNSSSNEISSVRYRMHYLPILHKQFEAENGNVCSYASFCDYVPESVVKPNGWRWKFCPCLPCINPELKFEKMVSEGILKMEGIELGDVLHDDTKENILMQQLRALRDSRQFFTYDAWERNSSGTINAKRRTASEPITIVVTKFLEELSMLKSHIQRTFYQYHVTKLARDRALHCTDEVTLHIECSPLSLYRNASTEPSSSDPAAVFTILTGYLWSQNCEQALAAVSENKDYSTSGIWAGLEKILLSVVKAGKRKINIISDSPTNKYRNKSNFYFMSDFAHTYGVCFRWIFLELSHQIGNANMIRDDIERTIKEQMCMDPDMSLIKSDIQKLLQSHTSIIVDSYSHDDVQKYKWNLPKLRAVQGTQKFDEVIILPEDFWVRDVIGFDTFKKLPF